MSTSTQATWPEGVTARYLNLGGATVDIRTHPGRGFDNAACTGCTATHRPFDYHGYYLDCGYSPAEAEEKALEAACENAAKWAQSHAEKCRAMPRPAVA
ncbi:hypothetical protein [Streptomyces sioyaensis]|uniref:hypothetical protein n=1 Tax=Streptomyces sioyaensis TaxID=67364 RepID=UPI0036E50465